MPTMRERAQQINIEYWEGRATMSEHVMAAALGAQYALLEKLAREVVDSTTYCPDEDCTSVSSEKLDALKNNLRG